MRMLFDFSCPLCGETFEALCEREQTEMPCRREEAPCEGSATRQIPVTTSFTKIQATHTKSKKLKAGYQHTHADRPKTPGKISVGYGTTNHSSS